MSFYCSLFGKNTSGRGESMKKKLIAQFQRTAELLKNCESPEKKESQDGWSIKEIVGHLIDSVSNNHQRLCRYIPGDVLHFPGYDQEACVNRANYRELDFDLLYTLWHHYNLLLFQLYYHIPEKDMDSEIKVGDRPAMSLRDLMTDYFAHMEIHEKQIFRIINT
jgi:hypothetical protein